MPDIVHPINSIAPFAQSFYVSRPCFRQAIFLQTAIGFIRDGSFQQMFGEQLVQIVALKGFAVAYADERLKLRSAHGLRYAGRQYLSNPCFDLSGDFTRDLILLRIRRAALSAQLFEVRQLGPYQLQMCGHPSRTPSSRAIW